MSAIENGIFTTTTKQRLEELEEQKKELSEKLLIEECKQTFELSKNDIQEYFKCTMKQCPDRAIELLIRTIKVYENKIEIELNYSTLISENERTIKKVFTETFTTQRQFKGSKTKTRTKTYDIYLII